MFVAVSRGREWVSLADFDSGGPPPAYTSCLPGPDVLEREGSGGPGSSANMTPSPRVATSGGAALAAGAAKRAPEEDWRKALARLVRSESLVVDDRSENGGALWVEGGLRLEGKLKPLGFLYSEKRAAWWRKP